ncbi:MAG: hypothetical protein WD077_01255 [Bacteroidia bacterium]
MKIKSAIVLLIISLTSSSSFGQTPSDYTDGVTKFINWFSDIDKVLTNISDKEKLKRIYRQLGYASEDIDNIALGKLLLATEISKLSNLSQQGELEKLKPQIDDILSDINKLVSRLELIKGDVSQTDQVIVDSIIQTIRIGFMNRKLYYLKDIKAFLYGEDISLSKIKDEANQAKKIADEAATKVKEAKLKIKEKLG